MSQDRRESVVGAAFAEHLSTPMDQGGNSELEVAEAQLDQQFAEVSNNLAEYGRFTRISEEGREPFSAVMSFMTANCTLRALRTICHGNNWQKIASTLALVFHTSEDVPLKVQKARGYDRLRDLVTTCVTDLRRENTARAESKLSVHSLPDGYDRLIERLFTSHGHQAP